MKSIQIGIIFLASFLIFPSVSVCEMHQLISESFEVKSDKIENYSVKKLTEIQSIKNFLISFVQSSAENQSKLITANFKETHNKPVETLSRTFDKESYSKIDFKKIKYFKNGEAVADTNLYWATEGYDGVQTFHFMLVKESGQWLVDWMVH